MSYPHPSLQHPGPCSTEIVTCPYLLNQSKNIHHLVTHTHSCLSSQADPKESATDFLPLPYKGNKGEEE